MRDHAASVTEHKPDMDASISTSAGGAYLIYAVAGLVLVVLQAEPKQLVRETLQQHPARRP